MPPTTSDHHRKEILHFCQAKGWVLKVTFDAHEHNRLTWRAGMQSVLLIDDDENLRDTIAVMLEQDGFRTEQASDGRAGLERAFTL